MLSFANKRRRKNKKRTRNWKLKNKLNTEIIGYNIIGERENQIINYKSSYKQEDSHMKKCVSGLQVYSEEKTICNTNNAFLFSQN